MEVIVGTAGHIDHGKTALIKALTGVDADRLPEEKRRGITVDLGFAERLISDVHFGFVDVPGHERFVKNMLAGASGIDVVMLVIAADEGVMPQTREHFDICRLLDVQSGIVVLTKTDLVDAETLELAKLDAAELVVDSFLENGPVITVSSHNGDGIDLLKETLVQTADKLERRNDELVVRLPIDRSFSVKGFGAVVTGTLASGKIREGDEVELLPSQTKVRVRGLQTHGKTVATAMAGQRVAVNIGGIDYSKVARGMCLAEPDVLRPTQIIDAEVEVLPNSPKPLRSRQRVRVHIGTAEVLARIQVLSSVGELAAGDKGFVQIRLEQPVIAVPGERFIVRRYSPQITIAGGKVIDTVAVRHRQKELLKVRIHLSAQLSANGDKSALVNILVAAAGAAGLSQSDLQSRTALQKTVLIEAIEQEVEQGTILKAGERYVGEKVFKSLLSSAESAVDAFHRDEPLARGISRESLREKAFAYLPSEVFNFAVTALQSSGAISVEKETIRLSSYKTAFSPEEIALRERIVTQYTNSGLEVPKLDDALTTSVAATKFTVQEARKFLQQFLDSGELVKVTEDFYFSRISIDKLIADLRKFASTTPDRLVDVARFKEIAGISRKYAIPLLEYFDREKITQRSGDKRLIR